MGSAVSRRGLHRVAAQPDLQAAIAERVPSPTAGPDGARAVGPADGLRLIHPASGASVALNLPDLVPDPNRAVALVEAIVDGLAGPRERFLAVWRLLPDQVAAEFGEDAARLPADTRIPDHTLFQHADITAGLRAAGAPDGTAYLSFALGPVQSFVRAARSVRDLWSGSALLSWLAFQAMKPILECLGPTAFVYPALRGSPLVDLWLRNEMGLGDRVPMPCREARLAPSLPNRFVAVVPWGSNGAEAGAIREACVDSARAGWRRLAAAVRQTIDRELRRLAGNWDRLWEGQIESAFDFRVTVAPAGELSDERLGHLWRTGFPVGVARCLQGSRACECDPPHYAGWPVRPTRNEIRRVDRTVAALEQARRRHGRRCRCPVAAAGRGPPRPRRQGQARAMGCLAGRRQPHRGTGSRSDRQPRR